MDLRKRIILICALIFTLFQTGITEEPVEVRVSAFIETDETPLNRTARYVIKLQWSGALDRVDFDQPETPKFSNFKLKGTSSSNWVGIKNGVNTSIKTFEYILQPESIGMGFIDGIRIDYTPNFLTEKYSLYTDRLSIKVIDAVTEPGEIPLTLILTIGLGFTIIAAGLFLFISKRHQKKKHTQLTEDEKTLSLEEEFANNLQASVDINTADTKTAFTELARILRQYLFGRFQIPVQGISISEVISSYRESENNVEKAIQLEEVLTSCDLHRFSGQQAEPGRLARVYTLTERFIKENTAAEEPIETTAN